MKKILSILAVLLILVLVGCETTSDWQKISDIKKYNDLDLNTITEIELHLTTDYPEWVIFSDQDLISKWMQFLADLEVKKGKKINRNSYEGGFPFVKIITSDSKYILTFFSFSDKQIVIDDYLYEFRSSAELPFNETYDEGEKRHGVVTPWD